MSETPHARFRERLARREPLVGMLLSLPSPEMAEMLAAAGFDWLFVDMEHGLLDFTAVQRMIQAVGRRVPVHRPGAEQRGDPDREGARHRRGRRDRPAREQRRGGAGGRAGGEVPAGRRAQHRRGARAGLRRGGWRRRSRADNEETVVVAQVEHVDAVAVDRGDRRACPAWTRSSSGRSTCPPAWASRARSAARTCSRRSARWRPRARRERCRAASSPWTAPGERRAAEPGHSLICAGTDTLLIASAASRLLDEARAAESGRHA